MDRTIITIPRVLMLATSCNWDIDWGGQSAGEDTGRSEQVVFNALPRWLGSPQIMLPQKTVAAWRALRWQVEGRKNAWSVPMIDPASYEVQTGTWESDWQAYQAGQYVEPRPVALCVSAVAAGATSITVNELALPEPVRAGSILSHNNWPFAVTARTGVGAAVVLSVKRLARAIPNGAEIDLYARGLFLSADGMMGNPGYGLPRRTAVDLSFYEWLGRA